MTAIVKTNLWLFCAGCAVVVGGMVTAKGYAQAGNETMTLMFMSAMWSGFGAIVAASVTLLVSTMVER